MRSRSVVLSCVTAGALALGISACGDSTKTDTASSTSGGSDTSVDASLSGTIAIDGSSTVYPFAQAAAEQFGPESPDVKITVGESGTGGGFEKFCAGETQISNASRPIEQEEIDACKAKGIGYSEVQVANDGIAVVTNKDLKIDCLTTEQLKKLWQKDSKITNYSQLDAKLPDEKVSLYGPGTDSGTFDFFTEEINGEKGDSRTDYQPSEDDNVLVEGVSGDKGGLGYFGFSYYEQNTDKLSLVGVDSGKGCITPTKADIQSGTYKPLSRPIFMYVSNDAIKKPEVKGFLDDVIDEYQPIAEAAKIVPMTEAQAAKAKTALEKAES